MRTQVDELTGKNNEWLLNNGMQLAYVLNEKIQIFYLPTKEI